MDTDLLEHVGDIHLDGRAAFGSAFFGDRRRPVPAGLLPAHDLITSAIGDCGARSFGSGFLCLIRRKRPHPRSRWAPTRGELFTTQKQRARDAQGLDV